MRVILSVAVGLLIGAACSGTRASAPAGSETASLLPHATLVGRIDGTAGDELLLLAGDGTPAPPATSAAEVAEPSENESLGDDSLAGTAGARSTAPASAIGGVVLTAGGSGKHAFSSLVALRIRLQI